MSSRPISVKEELADQPHNNRCSPIMVLWRLVRKLSESTSTWLLIVLAALSATRLYYLEDTIAALVIFSILLAGVIVAVLAFAVVVSLIDLVSQRAKVWAGIGVALMLSSIYRFSQQKYRNVALLLFR